MVLRVNVFHHPFVHIRAIDTDNSVKNNGFESENDTEETFFVLMLLIFEINVVPL